MKGEDSLEQMMGEDNTANYWPVLTIENLDHLDEVNYRERCVERIIEIVLDIDNYFETSPAVKTCLALSLSRGKVIEIIVSSSRNKAGS